MPWWISWLISLVASTVGALWRYEHRRRRDATALKLLAMVSHEAQTVGDLIRSAQANEQDVIELAHASKRTGT